MFYSNWWATVPALLKGFLGRFFAPVFAFKYRQNSPFWDKLLKEKTARLILIMETIKWYYFVINRNFNYDAIKNWDIKILWNKISKNKSIFWNIIS